MFFSLIPELSILDERKKKRTPKEEANVTKEKVTKNSKDETLIEITAPGAIPNFGKKSKPAVEKQNFESVFELFTRSRKASYKTFSKICTGVTYKVGRFCLLTKWDALF